MVGARFGVTLTEPDAGPAPALFPAWTEQLYEVPPVRPVTVIGEPLPLAVIPPGLHVTR
jgi:hypothetical protein